MDQIKVVVGGEDSDLLSKLARDEAAVKAFGQSVDRFSSSVQTMNKHNHQAKEGMDNFHGSVKHVHGSMTELEQQLMNVQMRVMNLTMAAGLLSAPFVLAAAASTKYLSTLETSQLGIAAAYMTGGQYVDATTGKVLQGEAALHAAQVDSRQMMEELQVANLQTTATLDQLVKAYQETLPVAMARGFSREQVKDFTSAMVQAAGAIGLSYDQMGEETRSLLTGSIDPRNSRIATVLGLRNEDLEQYKNNAQGLFTFLMEKLESYRVAGLAAQHTWDGLWSNFKDIALKAGGDSFQPLFEQVKYELEGMLGSVSHIDEKTKKITWNQGFLDGITAIKNGVTSTVAEFYRMTMLIDKAGGSITRLGYAAGATGWFLASAGGTVNKDNPYGRFATRMDELNKMFEGRYADSDKALQALANREMGLDANGNPLNTGSNARYKPKPPKPPKDDSIDITDQLYQKYTLTLDNLNKTLAQSNPYLTTQEKAMAGIYEQVGKLSDEMPQYVKTWNAWGEAMEHNIRLSEEFKTSQEEHADYLLGDGPQNDLGKMGQQRTKTSMPSDVGPGYAWESQQDLFDEASSANQWLTLREQQRQEDLQKTAEFNAMKAQLSGDGTQQELLRIQQEEDAWIQSWAMMTSSFDEYERRKTAIAQWANDQRTEIQRQADLKQKSMSLQAAQGYLSITADLVNTVAAFTNNSNKVMFSLSKAVAFAQAIVNANLAYTAQLASPLGGLTVVEREAQAEMVRAMGYASAAVIAATGISQGFGIGSGGGISSGGYGSGTPTSPVVTQPLGSQPQAIPNITVIIKGKPTDQWVEDVLVPELNDAYGRGIKLDFAHE